MTRTDPQCHLVANKWTISRKHKQDSKENTQTQPQNTRHKAPGQRSKPFITIHVGHCPQRPGIRIFGVAQSFIFELILCFVSLRQG